MSKLETTEPIVKQLDLRMDEMVGHLPTYKKYSQLKYAMLDDIQALFKDGEWALPSATEFNIDPHIAKVYDYLEDRGWQKIHHSCRIIFRRDDQVLKIAVDTNGLLQNYAECSFSKGPLSDILFDLQRPKNLYFAGVHNLDKKYYVVQGNYIPGLPPPQRKIKAIKDYLHRWNIYDVKPDNFVMHGNGVIHFIDAGGYNMHVYQLAIAAEEWE